jgi:hypothetical protein
MNEEHAALFFSIRGSLRFATIAKGPHGIDKSNLLYYDPSLDRKSAMMSKHFFADWTLYDASQQRHADLFARWVERSHPGTIDRLIKIVGLQADDLLHAYRGLAISQTSNFDFF